MAIIETDIVSHVFHSVEDTSIGQKSKYSTEIHPGSGKKIEGWKWDQRTWPNEGESRSLELAPSIWDPVSSGINESDFQSGYGDNKDLILLDVEEVSLSGLEVWAPNLNHGYFYVRDEEWYLYSDSYLTEYFTVTGIEASQQTLRLSRKFKPTIPINVRNFEFNRTMSRHEVNKDFRKKIEFTVNGTDPEFIVETTLNPPVLRLNGEYNAVIGQSIILSVSGTADVPDNDITNLDVLGVSDGADNQEFNFTFSPVDPSQNVEVWTWLDPIYPTSWTVIDSLSDFSTSGNDVKIDKDRGSIQFGNYNSADLTGAGNIPGPGSRIGAYYTDSVAAFYEPEGTKDEVLSYSSAADINPITSAIERGFVQITTESIDPASITLTSDLVKVNPFIIQLGNNIGNIVSEVKSSNGNVLEGEEVTFNILNPSVGTFGSVATQVTAITGSNGKAATIYNSPLTIEGLGQATTTVTHDSGNTIVDIEGLTEPASVSGVFLFKIHTSDEVLGIPESDEATYYTDYLNEQNITFGNTANQAFEEDYRTVNSLLKPTTYSATEIEIGKKTLLLTTRSGVMNPHTGLIDAGVLVPLYPDTLQNIGTSTNPILRLTYLSNLLELPGTGTTKAYFGVGDARTTLQAFVTNKRTNRKIYSNIIELEVQIPDSVNGVFFCSVLNDIPDGLLTANKNVDSLSASSINSTSGIDSFYKDYSSERNYVPASGIFESYYEWFVRTRRSDTVGLDFAASSAGISDPTLSGLDTIDPFTCPAEIPLGFRLKSTGITVASVLDQITFLDPNDSLPSGYHGI